MILCLGQPAQGGVVGGRRRQRPGEHGGVPGAADHRDPAASGLHRRPDGLAHVGLPAGLAPRLHRVGLRQRDPQLDHRLQQGREGRRGVPTGLDDVVPPPLGVVVAGRRGQRPERLVGRPAAGCRAAPAPGRSASSDAGCSAPSGGTGSGLSRSGLSRSGLSRSGLGGSTASVRDRDSGLSIKRISEHSVVDE